MPLRLGCSNLQNSNTVYHLFKGKVNRLLFTLFVFIKSIALLSTKMNFVILEKLVLLRLMIFFISFVVVLFYSSFSEFWQDMTGNVFKYQKTKYTKKYMYYVYVFFYVAI